VYAAALFELPEGWGDKCVNKLRTEWKNGLRRIWNLPYDAHCGIVTGLSGGMPILDDLLVFIAKRIHHSSALFVLLHTMVLFFLLLEGR